MPRELDDQLTKYLTDAHSIEVQALAQLKVVPEIAGAPELEDAFRAHLAETEGHERTITTLLEARGESPSRVKDAVMAVGGKGFVLFARSQPDTPGKLFAHALSYEALEFASYELLARVATRAGAGDVASAATRIAAEERSMMATLERNADAAVEAALREHPRDDLTTLVRKYLADAHALEQQSITLLERAPDLVEDAHLASVFADHLAESRDQSERIQQRLTELGGDSSSVKDAALRLGALNWSAFFQAHPDTPGKLAAFAYAVEHLEIGGYLQLERVARRAGDDETAQLAADLLSQEREAAQRIAGGFDAAAEASLEAVGAVG
jgi:ferritin-like metal-binding protein YciE